MDLTKYTQKSLNDYEKRIMAEWQNLKLHNNIKEFAVRVEELKEVYLK